MNSSYVSAHDPGDWTSSLARDRDKERAFHDVRLQALPGDIRQATEYIVRRLFPRVDGVLSSSSEGAGLQGEWRRDRRVCSPDAFPAYFRLALPLGTVSSTELRSVLALASDAFGLAETLAHLAGTVQPGGVSRARAVLSLWWTS
jgi:hypothetical protein